MRGESTPGCCLSADTDGVYGELQVQLQCAGLGCIPFNRMLKQAVRTKAGAVMLLLRCISYGAADCFGGVLPDCRGPSWCLSV